MIRFDSSIPHAIILVWFLTAAGLAVWTYLGKRHVMRPGYVWLLVSLRLMALTLVLLLLLRPYLLSEEPDAEAFKVVVLADSSGSMRVRDCTDDRTRHEVAAQALNTADGDAFLTGLQKRYRVETRLFTDETIRYNGGEFGILPGRTATGNVLAGELQEPDAAAIGALVLISDGNSNAGLPPVEAAKRLRQRGIPVTCIGIGSARAPGDVILVADDKPISGVKGQTVSIPVSVQNTFRRDVAVSIEFYDQDRLVETRRIPVKAETAEVLRFDVTPLQAGVRTYRARLISVPEDKNAENDVQYVAVEVKEPDTFRVLYLDVHLDWSYKFLKLLADSNDQLDLSAVIRTGDKLFHRTGRALGQGRTNSAEGFPETAGVLNDYDIVVLNTRTAKELTAEALKNLAAFADDRGGGILFIGPPAHLPAELTALLPAGETLQDRVVSRQYLDVPGDFIFPEARAASLQTPPGLFLPEDRVVYLATELKRGARPVLTLKENGHAVLATQQYGNGRTAFLGSDATWRWRMNSDADRDRFDTFWTHLLVWMGSTAKPRITAEYDGGKLPVDEPVTLKTIVRGADYLPSPDAQVTALLTAPDGNRQQLNFSAAVDTPGTFSENFSPRAAGEHTVALRAVFPDGSVLSQDGYFMAVHMGVESQDVSYREDVLRDIARVTGGTFVHYEDLGPRTEIAVSNNAPSRIVRRYWHESWFFLVLILALPGTEWYLRRRIGLK